MGCLCDALQNERERKGEANMNRLIGSEINVSLDEQNINKENQNNNNEESEIDQQNNINLFDLKPSKHEKRTNLRYVIENEENNFEKISEDKIKDKENDSHNILREKKLVINIEELIPKKNKNSSRVGYLPFNYEEEEEKDQLKFNKDLCKTLASSLPKRTKIEYEPFKDLLKLKTVNLSDKEKSFCDILMDM